MRLSTNQLSSSSKQSLTSNIHQKTLTSQLTSRPRLSVSVPSSANVINTSINHLPIKTEISTRDDDEDSDDIDNPDFFVTYFDFDEGEVEGEYYLCQLFEDYLNGWVQIVN